MYDVYIVVSYETVKYNLPSHVYLHSIQEVLRVEKLKIINQAMTTRPEYARPAIFRLVCSQLLSLHVYDQIYLYDM